MEVFFGLISSSKRTEKVISSGEGERGIARSACAAEIFACRAKRLQVLAPSLQPMYTGGVLLNGAVRAAEALACARCELGKSRHVLRYIVDLRKHIWKFVGTRSDLAEQASLDGVSVLVEALGDVFSR